MTGLGWTIPVLLVQLLLPVAAAMTGALHSWPVTGVICILAAAAGWAVLPQEALPVIVFWCLANGLLSCLPMKQRLLRPVLRSGMCLAAWGIGLIILLRLTGLLRAIHPRLVRLRLAALGGILRHSVILLKCSGILLLSLDRLLRHARVLHHLRIRRTHLARILRHISAEGISLAKARILGLYIPLLLVRERVIRHLPEIGNRRLRNGIILLGIIRSVMLHAAEIGHARLRDVS